MSKNSEYDDTIPIDPTKPRRRIFLGFVQIFATVLILSVNIFFICFVLLNSKSKSIPVSEINGNGRSLVNSIKYKYIDQNNSQNYSEKASDVVLYDNKNYDGKSLVLQNENEGCTNILDFNDKVSSVLIDANSSNKTTCIRLYGDTACLGRYIELTHESNCKHDISQCGEGLNFDNETSSVSRCDFEIPENPTNFKPEHIKTTRGEVCKDHCETHGDNWYSCFTDDLLTRWDYCSPRSEVDYYGYECEDDCAFRGDKDYSWCHLKKGGWGYCSVKN